MTMLPRKPSPFEFSLCAPFRFSLISRMSFSGSPDSFRKCIVLAICMMLYDFLLQPVALRHAHTCNGEFFENGANACVKRVLALAVNRVGERKRYRHIDEVAHDRSVNLRARI